MRVRLAIILTGLLCLCTVTTVKAEIPKKVKVSANDTTAGYLNGKLIAGGNISFTEGSDGGDETLTLDVAYTASTAGEYVYIEGATDDEYEHIIGSDDPTADRTLMLPNDAIAAGDVLVGDASNSLAYLALADTQILIGDGSGAPTAVTLSGDVTIASSGAVSIAANAVELATDTTGNYVATIADSGASEVTVANSGTENAAVTLAIAAGLTRDTEWDTITEINNATTDADIISTASVWSGGDLGGTGLAPSVTDDSHAHTGTTLSGIDISADTNLAGTAGEITLTDDTLSLDAAVTRDTEWDTITKINNATTDADIISTASVWAGGDLSGTGLAPTVSNDSHDHTTTTISGLDISNDTNLAVASYLDLTDDTLSVDLTEVTGSVTLGNGSDASLNWTWDLSGTDVYLTFASDKLTINNSLTVATGKNITLGTTQWNSSDGIDGEVIANDTIDDDSIDFTDVTAADLTLTDATTITASNLITGNKGIRTASGADGAGFVELMEDTDNGTEKIKLLGQAALTTDLNLILPASYGTANQSLTTDGAGNLYWATPAGSGDVTGVGDCAGGACLDGTSDGGTTIALYDGDSNKTTISMGNASGDLIFQLPPDDGDAGEQLQTNGSGVLTWEAAGGSAESLAATLAVGADANDVDTTSWGKMEGFDSGLYLDWDADGVIDLTSDGTLELHSADWDISTTGAITNASIDSDNNELTNIAMSETKLVAGRSVTLSTDTLNVDEECYTDVKCIYIEDPTADDDLKSIWSNRTPHTWTIASIWAESDQTVNFDLQVDDGTPADVIGPDLAPAAGEASTSELSGDTTVAQGDRLDLAVTSVSGTPTWLSICVTASWQD